MNDIIAVCCQKCGAPIPQGKYVCEYCHTRHIFKFGENSVAVYDMPYDTKDIYANDDVFAILFSLGSFLYATSGRLTIWRLSSGISALLERAYQEKKNKIHDLSFYIIIPPALYITTIAIMNSIYDGYNPVPQFIDSIWIDPCLFSDDLTNLKWILSSKKPDEITKEDNLIDILYYSNGTCP